MRFRSKIHLNGWMFAIDVDAQCTIFIIRLFLIDSIWFLNFLSYFFFFNFFLGNRRLIQRRISIELWTVLEKYIQCVHINSVSVVTHTHTYVHKSIPLKGSKWHGLFISIFKYNVVYVCIGFGGGLRCFCFIQINMATVQWKW